MHRYLLFDLDGTLTDPAEGITKCVQYALSYFGQAERRPEELYCYIGPPLPESFETYGGLSREEALLAVATSKPEVFAKEILGHFGLSEYFQEIVGSELDGTRMGKAEVIREAFARLTLEEADKPLTAMIGDRKHDIVGAKKNGIASVGVAFGYAEEGELEEAGADRIVASVSALRKLLLAW